MFPIYTNTCQFLLTYISTFNHKKGSYVSEKNPDNNTTHRAHCLVLCFHSDHRFLSGSCVFGGLCINHKEAHTPVKFAQAGNVSRWNMALPQVLMASVMQRMPMMFITIPVLAWWRKTLHSKLLFWWLHLLYFNRKFYNLYWFLYLSFWKKLNNYREIGGANVGNEIWPYWGAITLPSLFMIMVFIKWSAH